MKRLLFLLLVAAGFISTSKSSAAVFERDWKTPGDGLLTYDDVNRREWLDVPESLMAQFPGSSVEEKFQNSLTELGPGGLFEGFILANSIDVIALAQSSGINTMADDLITNQTATMKLIELLDITDQLSNGGAATRGLLDELVGPPPFDCPCHRVANFVVTFQTNNAGLFFGPVGGDPPFVFSRLGLMLYRQIPEPSTAAVVITLLIACTRARFRVV